jgi:hypothetical protein
VGDLLLDPRDFAFWLPFGCLDFVITQGSGSHVLMCRICERGKGQVTSDKITRD